MGISEALTSIFQILDHNLALVRHELMDTKGFIPLKIPSCLVSPTAIISFNIHFHDTNHVVLIQILHITIETPF